MTKNGTAAAQYAYDANGNRLSRTTPQGTVTAAYDDRDRLTRHGTANYVFGPAGDLKSKTDTATSQTTTYAYDAAGNLISVTLPAGMQVDYVVDGAGVHVRCPFHPKPAAGYSAHAAKGR